MSFGETFLVEPDLFPGRQAGAPWGEIDVTIAFAGRRYRVRGLAEGQLARIRERFGTRVGESAREDVEAVELSVFRAPAEEFLHARPRLWEVTFDRDPQPKALRVAGLRFAGRLDWRPRLVASLWTCVGDDPELPMVFENFFRLVAAYDLAEHGGALVHSAAVAVPGGAYVFCGPSGAGKTTISERAQAAGLKVLSDDLNALGSSPGEGPRVEKVPFSGTLGGGPEVVPPLALLAICRLRKGPAVKVTPLSAAVALAGLLAASPFVNADPFRAPALEASLLDLARSVPVFELSFALESPFGEVLTALAAALNR